MDASERANLLIERCQQAQYPSSLIYIVQVFLSGENAPALAQQEWELTELVWQAVQHVLPKRQGHYLEYLLQRDAARFRVRARQIASNDPDEDNQIDALEALFHESGGADTHLLQGWEEAPPSFPIFAISTSIPAYGHHHHRQTEPGDYASRRFVNCGRPGLAYRDAAPSG